MTEKKNEIAEVVDKNFEKSVRAQEYTVVGHSVKRADPEALLRVRDQISGEERVRRGGNVLQRAGNIAMRRG